MEFQLPVKRIKEVADLAVYKKSVGRKYYLKILGNLNSAVCGIKNSDKVYISANCRNVMHVLTVISMTCDGYDLKHEESSNLRYGSSAFRDWHLNVTSIIQELLYDILPPNLRSALVELLPYFIHSFGNEARLDYGTGHEASFVAFLACLSKIGFLKRSDQASLVTCVFKKYAEVTRHILRKFRLEPAGSLGVWGLDDYCFLPFLWGASQFIFSQQVVPGAILEEQIDAYDTNYLFLSSISFVRKMKKGPIRHSSPMIFEISSLSSWYKINNGLLKMYEVECLSKLPVVQHFLFGSLLEMQPG